MSSEATGPLERPLTKKQVQGGRSRETILDAAELLMARSGYAATTISDIRHECGLPPSSIYWHFGSKEGLLAAVMERGANRWFAAIPRWDELDVPDGDRLDALLHRGARSLDEHPEFLRLFYMLSLERSDDPVVAEIVRRVRDAAIARFRDGISHSIASDLPDHKASALIDELTAFCVAVSDGCFFAAHLEPDRTDLGRMFVRLGQAAVALIPQILADL
mgnify:CR=1 FL=1|jgi:AcrR family transcriptional regulator